MVYHQPVNRYVAEFLGRGNVVSVQRSASDTVATPWGEIKVDNLPDHPQLEMFIRPQWLEIVAGGEGQLLEQHFLGTHADCKIQWEGKEWHAWHADAMPIGTENVSLLLRP